MRLSSLLFIAFLFLSCTKEELENKSLVGRWQWLQTDGGIAHHIHETPQSTGNKIEIEFTSDKKCRKYFNDSLIFDGTYSLLSRKCIHDQRDKPVIITSDSSGLNMMIENLTTDSLLLSDEVYDGVESTFKKITP